MADFLVHIYMILFYITIVTLKNGVQTNRDGGFILCPMVLKYSILTLLIINKMLIYIFFTRSGFI